MAKLRDKAVRTTRFFIRRNYIISAVAGSFLLAPGAENVSFRKQVEPIFAFHCNGCHGDDGVAAGLDTSSYSNLRKGGELGNDIVAGDPDASEIVQRIEGRRGERRRMPLGSRPLTGEQIGQIRAWIKAGARDDGVSVPVQRLNLRGLKWGRAGEMRISCQVPTEAYVVLWLRASAAGRTLHREGASVRLQPEKMNAGAPGDWIRWTLRREPDWPGRVDVKVEIRYAPAEPIGARLVVADDSGRELGSREYRRVGVWR
jgi:mono/diheme cytochrome c family protein